MWHIVLVVNRMSNALKTSFRDEIQKAVWNYVLHSLVSFAEYANNKYVHFHGLCKTRLSLYQQQRLLFNYPEPVELCEIFCLVCCIRQAVSSCFCYKQFLLMVIICGRMENRLFLNMPLLYVAIVIGSDFQILT